MSMGDNMIFFENKTYDIYITQTRNLTFVPHLHHNAELMICMEGEQEMMCGYSTKVLKPGDMMIAFPNKVHSYRSISGCAGVMCIINPDILPALTPYFKKQSSSCYYSGGQALIELASLMLDEYENDRSKEILIGYLYVILGKAFKDMCFCDSKSVIDNKTFSKVIVYISENYKNEISLKSIARCFGINHCHLSRLFSENLGCGFCKYIHELRINYAKMLLCESDIAIGDISFECGFSTQRSFNRVFKKITSMSPKEYRLEKTDK